MLNNDLHPLDQELLLAADGELPSRRATQVRSHLAACWGCRARMAEIEGTIASFARAYRQTVDPKLSPVAGPRALFRVQLAELVAKPNVGVWPRYFPFAPATRSATTIAVALFVAVLLAGFLVQHSTLRGEDLSGIAAERGVVPDHSLTPGATRKVSISEVCSTAHEEVVREAPASLRQEIFQEYGIVNPRPDDYEIDYLIAPGLGGTADIPNLWPEPYKSRTWNAHVKDTLEERLHQMVCAGKLDLSSAQRDIATDWIVAYKKHFHTDRPLSRG